MSGIPISQKHGVNSSLAVCFWCGRDTGEIILFGKLPGDKEAPFTAVVNYNPCDQCKEEWDKGIPILEASRTPMYNKQPPLAGAYPTGRLIVIKQSAMNEPEKFPLGKPVFMEMKEFQDSLDNFDKQENE